MDAIGVLASRVSADASLVDQIVTFFSFGHLTLVYGVIGVVLMGISCGVLGSFVMLRGMSLLGDSIGHAVLPGVCLAFVVMQTKNVVAIFVGAVLAGVLAALAIFGITRYSRIKADAAIGLILSGFFGVGVVFLTRIQRMSFGDQSGLDKYMFGDAAALGRSDLQLMAVVTAAVLVVLAAFFRHFQVTTFDEEFAASIGIPARGVHAALMTMLALAIVVALQAVGVVLVSAMLITPAATAYLLTNRLQWTLAVSAAVGVFSGLAGLFLSFVFDRIPTGPCIVLAASTCFALAYLFSPKMGLVPGLITRIRNSRRIQRENLLKAAYGLLNCGPPDREIALADLARARAYESSFVRRVARSLRRVGMATVTDNGMVLSPAGYRRAAQVVRNHRLWELFLTREASLAEDHVHRDAEEIEHVLGEEIVAQLERDLDNPTLDPHGRRIPPPIPSVVSPSEVSSEGAVDAR